MKHVPFNLKILNTCLPDYFQGFGGPVIAFPVDARMTYSEMIAKLTDDDAWPGNADIEDIRAAVIDLVGQVHPEASRPYFDIGPDEPAEGYFVSRHPTIDDMWMVIDKQDGEILGSWPTEKIALCEAGDENTADVYAYFGIELEVPEGYTTWRRKDNDNAWYWEDELGVDEGDFDTEMEAKVAAWEHKLAQKVGEWSAGVLELGQDDQFPSAGITYNPKKGATHYRKILVYGDNEEDARQLRQRIIDFLNSEVTK